MESNLLYHEVILLKQHIYYNKKQNKYFVELQQHVA